MYGLNSVPFKGGQPDCRTRTPKIEVVASCINPTPAALETEGVDGRLWDAPAALRVWHVASLDAPTVALVWSCAFAWVGGVRVPAWAPGVLALIAWAVYIGDRLLDARAGMRSPPLHLLRERHQFHWRHRWILAPAGLAAALAAAGLVFTRLPADACAPDMAVAAATLAYFSGLHSRGKMWHVVERRFAPFLSRPFVVGVLFTAGCLLPAASQIPLVAATSFAEFLTVPALFFAALAWLNCYAIEQWESASWRSAQTRVARMGGLFAAVGVVLAFVLVPYAPRAAWLVAAGSASGLLFIILDRIRPRLTPVALRAAADLVLLTPVIVLVLAR